MRIAVVNYCGSIGKSTVAKHLLAPRLVEGGARLIAVETINSHPGADQVYRGDQFDTLMRDVRLNKNIVVDVGASNVEQFVLEMNQYEGSHEAIDLYVVPTTPDRKQQEDTMRTLYGLQQLGVSPKKIRVVFNRQPINKDFDDSFGAIEAYHAKEKNFTLRKDLVINDSKVYKLLLGMNRTLSDVVNDPTDYDAALEAAKNEDEENAALDMIAAKQLAKSASRNLDAVFPSLVK